MEFMYEQLKEEWDKDDFPDSPIVVSAQNPSFGGIQPSYSVGILKRLSPGQTLVD